MLGFTQLLIHSVKAHELDEAEILGKLEWIETSALRCKRIVDALVDFSARGAATGRNVDVLGLLEMSFVLLRHELAGKEAVLEAHLPVEPIVVQGDPALLLQALAHVLANARDAVTGGGRVRVEVAGHADRVVVSVRDSGPGIPAGDRDRIFEPFFSTKEVGQGTGLGLCAARGIVRMHGGEIRVVEPGSGGTCIELELPRTPAAPPRHA